MSYKINDELKFYSSVLIIDYYRSQLDIEELLIEEISRKYYENEIEEILL